MARLDELWREVNGPGVPPTLDSRRVKARVNAALDADQAERKIYMKQKLRAALIAAAALAALTGTAFAATTGWTGLSAWFKGDAAPVREYVDSQVRSVSDQDYTFTVEGSAADESSVYLTVAITALNDEANAFLHSDEFNSMDTFSVSLDYQEEPSHDGPDDAAAGIWYSFGWKDLESTEENSRRFAVSVNNIPYPVKSIRVRCGYMEKGKRVIVPVNAVPSVTVKIGASGDGVLEIAPTTGADDLTITVEQVVLSPLTCRIDYQGPYTVRPNIRLRMADGSILTQSQLLEINDQLREIQDLDNIVSVIVFDMEYPLDGSKPTPVEHDPALDPITVTRMEKLADDLGYSVPVRELTEKLGGTCVWDAATGNVTCTWRGVTIVLHAGRDTALVDGETVELLAAPAEQGGVLAADWLVFEDAWGLDGFVQREKVQNSADPADTTIIWGDWYIIP